MQTSCARIQEGLQERSIHLLQEPIIEDTRLKLCDWFSFEEVEVFGGDNAWDQIISAVSYCNLKTGLGKQNGLGPQRFACSCFSNPSDPVSRAAA